ncbi:MAG TPA: hypothetical protein VFE46_02140 [Pirellulales bacterium]|nr:hypothetical protein [Pirellulales bacterium]
MRIQQTLHGYSEGHRLLASSRRLSASSQRTMRTLTDLSGPRLALGFEDYFSGYTLPDDRLFVFSRTWYADDAERPGCVWTHSLLLNEDDLRSISGLQSLTEFFRRPRRGEDVSIYEKEITAAPSNIESASPYPRAYVAKVITALFGDPAPVVLPDVNSAKLASLHFEMWRLNHTLTGQWLQFCTGAIQLRQSPRGIFDLQTVPMQSMREVIRSANNIQVVTEADGVTTNWAEEFAIGSRMADFAIFVEKYATFPIDGRGSVGPYAMLFRNLKSDCHDLAGYVEIIKQLQDLFSDQHQGARLKVAVASGPLNRHFFSDLPDRDVLATLVKEDEHNAFDAATLDIPNRVMTAWKAAPQDTISLVRTALRGKNEISRLIVSTFSESLRTNDIAALIEWASDLIPIFVVSNPNLLTAPSLWRASDVVREAALEAMLQQALVPDNVLFAVIESQLDSGATDLAGRMTAKFKVRTADALLLWAVANKWQRVPEDWQAALEELGNEFTSWLIISLDTGGPKTFALPRVLAARSLAARSLPCEHWIRAIVTTADIDSHASSLCLYVLNLGLERSDSHGEEMVSTSFPRVYLAASQNALDDRLWKVVEESFDNWWWWDRCRTLRTGLVNEFTAKRWSLQHFVRALPAPQVLWDILSAWGWDRNEKKFLASAIQYLLSGQTQAEPGFRDVAAQCAHWFDVD